MSQLQTIGSHKTTVATDDGFTRVTYHQTAVVKFNHNEIILNSGGWETVTTKSRMNQTSNQFDLGFRVYQKDYEWFVECCGKIYDFFDGMRIDRRKNTVTKKSELPYNYHGGRIQKVYDTVNPISYPS
tara:strand:- start:43 stop:426 length:384 start_codon:yes stop_codon:yes gene_type:complete